MVNPKLLVKARRYDPQSTALFDSTQVSMPLKNPFSSTSEKDKQKSPSSGRHGLTLLRPDTNAGGWITHGSYRGQGRYQPPLRFRVPSSYKTPD